MGLPPDLIDLLAAFADADVRFLVVGGYAVGAHGHPRFTNDIDLWLAPEPSNVAAAVSALATFGAPPAVIDGLRQASGLDVVWMGSPPVRIDFMLHIPGLEFEDAWPRRVTTVWDGARVSIIGREDLITAKLASGRDVDRLDAEALSRKTET